jgi:hypothetical protein
VRAELSDSDSVTGSIKERSSQARTAIGQVIVVERGRFNNKKGRRTKAGEQNQGNDKALTQEQAVACPGRRASSLNVELVVKHFEQRRRFSEQKRLYLRVGDEVYHLRYEEWGTGVVMEIMTSSVPGGTCLARIRFQDGQMRCFNNDLDNEACCYFFGVRRCWDPSQVKDGIRAKFFEMKG